MPTVQEESEDRQGSNGATASRRADGVGGSGIPGCFGGAGTGKCAAHCTSIASAPRASRALCAGCATL